MNNEFIAPNCQIRDTTCCGMWELNGLNDGEHDVIAAIQIAKKVRKRPIIVFTDRVSFGHGLKFARFIRENKLGTLHSVSPVRNPNSGYNVQAWLWKVDHTKVDEWAKKNIEFKQKRMKMAFSSYTTWTWRKK